MAEDLLATAGRLSERGEPFALATVVRCDAPTSAKPGAKALIRLDGTIAGWIGGSCAEPVVVKEALTAIQDGQPRLIALVGDGGVGPAGRAGVRQYTMTCHSGGTLEIYVEPVLPKPQLLLVGRGPVIDTLARLAGALDFSVTVVSEISARLPESWATPRAAIVVATHGTSDEDALEHALRSDAGYVSLVASRKRAEAVAAALRARGLPAQLLARLKAPAGLDIGATRPDEIAVSILAEIIQVSKSHASPSASSAGDTPDRTEARDPVCGMLVEVATARYRSAAGGTMFYFCCASCQQKFEQDPARYLGSRPAYT